MFEFHMLVFYVVMFNIMELIMEILLNYSKIKNLTLGNFLHYQ
jgi:hypothetical protein